MYKEKKKCLLFCFSWFLTYSSLHYKRKKKRIFIFKYCKIDVESAATLIFATTLITAPTVLYSKIVSCYMKLVFTSLFSSDDPNQM
jgi:hypothetical protein